MIKKNIIFIFAFLLLTLWCCKKKLFAKVEVKGTLTDYFTNQPIQSSVSLAGNDGNEKNAQPAISLKTIVTDANGNFSIKSSAVKTGNYYLSFHSINMNSIKGWYENVGKINKVKISEKTTKDFGQLFESTHTFYCKVTLNYTSGLDNDFMIYLPYDKGIKYNKTNAFFTTYVEYSKDQYESNLHNYLLNYILIGPSFSQNITLSIPITNKDTVYASINY